LFGREALKTGMEGPNLSVAQRVGYGIAFVGGRLAWSKFTVRSHWYSYTVRPPLL
jgi:hypothetical protein